MKRAGALAALLSALVAAFLLPGACRRAPAARHVLLVVLDATHAAELGCYGGRDALTPHLDALAAGGVRFDRAFSNTTWTLPSTTSLLTGLLQESHGVVTNDQRAPAALDLLPEAFSRSGWRTAGFVQMVYASGAYGLDQGFEHYVYRPHDPGEETESLVDQARTWLAEHADEDTFTYLHLRRPHSPYDPTPRNAIEWVGPWPFGDHRPPKRAVHADVAGERPLSDEDREGSRYLYRANLATVDRELAELLAEWGGRGDTLVVVTSDHGEGFGQHGFFGHGKRLWAEVVDVPLVFAGFGLAPRVDREPACTVDVTATLVDLCELDDFGPGDGRSLRARLAGETDPMERPIPISSRYVARPDVRPEVGAVLGDLKIVVDAEGSVRAFDRAADPAETRPLEGAFPDLVRLALDLRERGLAHSRAVGERAELTDDLRAELRALGYEE